MDSLIIVFVCHDDESIKKVLSHEYPILFVGNKPIANEFRSNKNIYILREFEFNIENEYKLLTFTAWYGIIKNNLFTNYNYICILEYDVLFDNHFINNLNTVCKTNNVDVISFFNDNYNQWFLCDINKLVLQHFLNIKNIKININNPVKWAPTTNQCMRREILSDFVDFYYPDCLEIKKYDIDGLSWYHERIFSLYLTHKDINYIEQTGLQHIVNNSHKDFNNKTIKQHKKYFLVYDDGTHTTYLDKLISSVKQHSDFIVIIYNKSDIDTEFMTNNDRILNEKRGGGYWLWKPYIINKTLSKIDEGDYLFYLDSKYYFVENFKDLYENIMKKNDIILWSNKPNENTNYMKNYCKMDIIKKYDIEDIVLNQNATECWAGAIFIKKMPYIEKLMKEWLTMCCCVYEDISDTTSLLPNYKNVSDHRHDQSLLSVLVYKYNINLHFFEKKYLQNVRLPW